MRGQRTTAGGRGWGPSSEVWWPPGGCGLEERNIWDQDVNLEQEDQDQDQEDQDPEDLEDQD